MRTNRIFRKFFIGALAVMAGLAVMSFVFVGCGHRGTYFKDDDAKSHLEWFSGKIADRLDLSTDQKARVDVLLTELHEKRGKSRQWRQSLRQDVLTLVRQEQIDLNDIDRIVAPMQQHMKEMVAFAGDRIIEFHALLTPDQREKLAKEIETHQHKHGKWRRCRFN